MMNLGMTFLITSLIMSVLIALIMLLNRAFPKLITANLRYMIWLIILIGLVVPFRPSIGNGVISVNPPEAIQSQQPITSAVQSPDNKPATVTNDNSGTNTGDTAAAKSNNMVNVLVVIWAVGALGILGFNIYQYFKFFRMIKRWGVDVEDNNTLTIFESAKKNHGIENKKIGLKVCNFVNTSMITGLLNPVILLPDKHLDEDELEVIFNHELVHYKRHDLFVKLLIILVSAVHWYNPIVYWMCSTMQMDGEAACDEVVLEGADIEDRQFYGEVIISMIGKKNPSKTALSTCFYAGKSGIKRRLDFIMDARQTKKGIAVIGITLVAIVTLLSGSIVALNGVNNNSTDSGNYAVATSDESAKKAEQIALEKVGGGTVVKNEIDYDDGRQEYDITVSYNEKIYEINVDAATFEITKYEIENNGNTASSDTKAKKDKGTSANKSTSSSGTKSNSSAKITAAEAKRIAINRVGGGRVTEISRDYEDGRDVYEVTVVKGNKEYDMKIDVNTGRITDYEVDDFEYDD